MGDPQTGEQLYQRGSNTVGKVLGATADFPTWRSSKGTGFPRNLILKSAGCDYRTSKDWGKRQNLVCPRTQEKGAVTPQEPEPDLPGSVCVSGSGELCAQGHWQQQPREARPAGHSPLGGGHHYPCHRAYNPQYRR